MGCIRLYNGLTGDHLFNDIITVCFGFKSLDLLVETLAPGKFDIG